MPIKWHDRIHKESLGYGEVKQMKINILKMWFYTKILKRQYVMGIDYSNGRDYSCKVDGYRDKNGVIKITNIKYF